MTLLALVLTWAALDIAILWAISRIRDVLEEIDGTEEVIGWLE